MEKEIRGKNLFDKHDTPYKNIGSITKKAKSLGLSYLGFGRYGVKNKEGDFHVTHISKNNRLIPIGQEVPKKSPEGGLAIYKKEAIKVNSSKFPDWTRKYQSKYDKDVEKNKDVDLDHTEDFLLDKWPTLSVKDRKILNTKDRKRYESAGLTKNKGYLNVLSDFVDDSSDINNFLYNDKSLKTNYDTRKIKWKINTLDDLLDEDELKSESSYSVYCGTKAKLEKGHNFIFKGFISTSADHRIAADFIGSKKSKSSGDLIPTLVQIDIKKGQKVLNVGALSKDITYVEEEHLLPRNTMLNIKEGPIITKDAHLYRAEIVDSDIKSEDE